MRRRLGPPRRRRSGRQSAPRPPRFHAPHSHAGFQPDPRLLYLNSSRLSLITGPTSNPGDILAAMSQLWVEWRRCCGGTATPTGRWKVCGDPKTVLLGTGIFKGIAHRNHGPVPSRKGAEFNAVFWGRFEREHLAGVALGNEPALFHFPRFTALRPEPRNSSAAASSPGGRGRS